MEFALSNRPAWAELLQSGNHIYIGSDAAVPNALITNAKGLDDIELVNINTRSKNRSFGLQYRDNYIDAHRKYDQIS
jgi:hypothetical protein